MDFFPVVWQEDRFKRHGGDACREPATLPQIQWLGKSPGENSQSCGEVHHAEYDYFNMLGVPAPSWKALCPVQERKQDSKTLSGIGDSGET